VAGGQELSCSGLIPIKWSYELFTSVVGPNWKQCAQDRWEHIKETMTEFNLNKYMLHFAVSANARNLLKGYKSDERLTLKYLKLIWNKQKNICEDSGIPIGYKKNMQHKVGVSSVGKNAHIKLEKFALLSNKLTQHNTINADM
jgi:hypothetical protein